MAQPVNPAFNKFNSLDRRALNKRQNSGGLLKLVTPTGSGPESLPIVGRLTGAILNQFDRGNNKEPERRHSSYDSSTNSRNGLSSSSGSNNRVSCRAGGQPSAININGLPDPFSGRINQSTSLYSSQESLHRGGSGTPLRPTSSTGKFQLSSMFFFFEYSGCHLDRHIYDFFFNIFRKPLSEFL